jgi:hypothetical protein
MTEREEFHFATFSSRANVWDPLGAIPSAQLGQVG